MDILDSIPVRRYVEVYSFVSAFERDATYKQNGEHRIREQSCEVGGLKKNKQTQS